MWDCICDCRSSDNLSWLFIHSNISKSHAYSFHNFCLIFCLLGIYSSFCSCHCWYFWRGIQWKPLVESYSRILCCFWTRFSNCNSLANEKKQTRRMNPTIKNQLGRLNLIQWLNQNQIMMSRSFWLKTSKKNHKNDFSILFSLSLNPPQNKSFHPTKSKQKKPFLTLFETNYRSHSLIENIPPTHPLRHLISMQMYTVYMTPFKVNLSRNKEKQTDNIPSSTMTPHFYDNILNIWPHLKWICPETKQNNRQTIFPMTLNTIDDTFFPTHSDTHFLCKFVENITPFQI